MSDIHSNQAAVFLKPAVKIEPLACRWYAWSYLVAPAQLALNLAYRLLPLLQSFLSNPACCTMPDCWIGGGTVFWQQRNAILKDQC